jgi:hypothetical protein
MGGGVPVEVPELVDEFEGEWVLLEVWRGDRQLDLGAPGSVLAFNQDGTGEFYVDGAVGVLECRYGETLEGLPMVRFKWEGHADGAAARGSGYALLRFENDQIDGELKIGRGSALTFEARRKHPRERQPVREIKLWFEP